MICKEAEYQLTNDGAYKGNIGDVFECIRFNVDISILAPQRSIHGTNDLSTLENSSRRDCGRAHVVDVTI